MRVTIGQLRHIIKEEMVSVSQASRSRVKGRSAKALMPKRQQVSTAEILRRFENELDALPPKIARWARDWYQMHRANKDIISAVRLVANDLLRIGYDIGLADANVYADIRKRPF
jgi:hypothetical protein